MEESNEIVGSEELYAMGAGDPQHDKWMGKHPGKIKYKGTPRPEGDLEFKLIPIPDDVELDVHCASQIGLG